MSAKVVGLREGGGATVESAVKRLVSGMGTNMTRQVTGLCEGSSASGDGAGVWAVTGMGTAMLRQLTGLGERHSTVLEVANERPLAGMGADVDLQVRFTVEYSAAFWAHVLDSFAGMGSEMGAEVARERERSVAIGIRARQVTRVSVGDHVGL